MAYCYESITWKGLELKQHDSKLIGLSLPHESSRSPDMHMVMQFLKCHLVTIIQSHHFFIQESGSSNDDGALENLQVKSEQVSQKGCTTRQHPSTIWFQNPKSRSNRLVPEKLRINAKALLEAHSHQLQNGFGL